MKRLSPRTLRGQLTVGLVALPAVACLAVGITTALALRGFPLLSRPAFPGPPGPRSVRPVSR
ncbi:hypothetical protein ABWJ92_34045 [Streptomyces sp. NPDC000609]|uniref:hypothetical protein n=1 Tax=Streptomyces sp. NPDC000609 TaxID=3160957 RepID=UPI0033931E45